jgi:hypothetical protein
MGYQSLTPDTEWAAGLVASLPVLWQLDMLAEWSKAHATDRTAGNLAHMKRAGALEALRIPLDATDADLIHAAETLAHRCFDLGTIHHEPAYLEEAMRRVCQGQGIEPPDVLTCTHEGAIARMTSPMWWRRRLRRMHGRKVEAAAIQIGRVHKRAEIYASNQTCTRRAQQQARNAATLESTIATNEEGQEYTLAELAATGTANKAIKRAELMTRISGFERIARDCKHEGLFLTITCPSRMHKWRTAGPWRVEENPKYDGTTPREANGYLGRVWARIRAALARAGAKLYGFRIAEPQHDGTPHWHMLVFHAVGMLDTIKRIVSVQALKDSPDERGAAEHRCDFKPIDWSRGSAAGYIAKYIAKNIDGYRVEKDLHGNPTMETSQRVEAWASTWGIRQFQQIGGPPVGPWRELRRVKDAPEGAPVYMREAWEAVNKLTTKEGQDDHTKSVSWDRYVRAQGGVFCGRAYRVRVAMRDRPGVLNCYGEPAGPVPCGVESFEVEHYTPAHMAHMKSLGKGIERTVHYYAESVRHVWTIKRAAKSRAIEGVFMGTVADRAPWTCVNNCTDRVSNGNERNDYSNAESNAKGAEKIAFRVEWPGADDQNASRAGDRTHVESARDADWERVSNGHESNESGTEKIAFRVERPGADDQNASRAGDRTHVERLGNDAGGRHAGRMPGAMQGMRA